MRKLDRATISTSAYFDARRFGEIAGFADR
jgi:hypothetical protein